MLHNFYPDSDMSFGTTYVPGRTRANQQRQQRLGGGFQSGGFGSTGRMGGGGNRSGFGGGYTGYNAIEHGNTHRGTFEMSPMSRGYQVQTHFQGYDPAGNARFGLGERRSNSNFNVGGQFTPNGQGGYSFTPTSGNYSNNSSIGSGGSARAVQNPIGFGGFGGGVPSYGGGGYGGFGGGGFPGAQIGNAIPGQAGGQPPQIGNFPAPQGSVPAQSGGEAAPAPQPESGSLIQRYLQMMGQEPDDPIGRQVEQYSEFQNNQTEAVRNANIAANQEGFLSRQAQLNANPPNETPAEQLANRQRALGQQSSAPPVAEPSSSQQPQNGRDLQTLLQELFGFNTQTGNQGQATASSGAGTGSRQLIRQASQPQSNASSVGPHPRQAMVGGITQGSSGQPNSRMSNPHSNGQVIDGNSMLGSAITQNWGFQPVPGMPILNAGLPPGGFPQQQQQLPQIGGRTIQQVQPGAKPAPDWDPNDPHQRAVMGLPPLPGAQQQPHPGGGTHRDFDPHDPHQRSVMGLPPLPQSGQQPQTGGGAMAPAPGTEHGGQVWTGNDWIPAGPSGPMNPNNGGQNIDPFANMPEGQRPEGYGREWLPMTGPSGGGQADPISAEDRRAMGLPPMTPQEQQFQQMMLGGFRGQGQGQMPPPMLDISQEAWQAILNNPNDPFWQMPLGQQLTMT